MKYLFINSVYGVRSTGKIIKDTCHTLIEQGHTCAVGYGREAIEDSSVQLIRIGSKLDYQIHGLLSRTLDRHGLASKKATKEFLKEVEAYNPDVVWLHNIHGYYINYEILFSWLKKYKNIQVYWTLHDCWAFTGHCAYFTMARCEKWKSGCSNCSQLKSYPTTIGLDNSKSNYKRKKDAFTGVSNLTLVTPSKWLADLTRLSFLKEYPVQVIHNTINESVFKPVQSDFKEKNDISDKYMVLGVAVGFEETKGYYDMLELRKILPANYVIVVVGLDEERIQSLPSGMIGLSRTKNQQELVEIYSAADVFVNPTHQDNYPTVNLEAKACGTEVVTYNVGGSPESCLPENVVEENDIQGLKQCICRICEK